jgi:hypothetical protein
MCEDGFELERCEAFCDALGKEQDWAQEADDSWFEED